jgi:hypothetical protein
MYENIFETDAVEKEFARMRCKLIVSYRSFNLHTRNLPRYLKQENPNL